MIFKKYHYIEIAGHLSNLLPLLQTGFDNGLSFPSVDTHKQLLITDSEPRVLYGLFEIYKFDFWTL